MANITRSWTRGIGSSGVVNESSVPGDTVTSALNYLSGVIVSSVDTWDRVGTTLITQTDGDAVAIGASVATTGYILTVSGRSRIGDQTQTLAGISTSNTQADIVAAGNFRYPLAMYAYQANNPFGAQLIQYRSGGLIASPDQVSVDMVLGGFAAGGMVNHQGTQLISSWTNNNYDTFTSTGARITSAIRSTSGTQTAFSDSFAALANGASVIVTLDLTLTSGTAPTIYIANSSGTAVSNQVVATAGHNRITLTTTTATGVRLQVQNTANGNWSTTGNIVIGSLSKTFGNLTAGVLAYAGETYTDENQASYLTFVTTPVSASASQERMRISTSGSFGFNTAGDPEVFYHVKVGDSGVSPSGDIFYEDSGILNIEYGFGSGQNLQFNMYEGGSGESWQMVFDGSNNEFRFFNSTVGQWLVQRSSETVINEGGADTDTRIEVSGETHMLVVKSSTKRVGIQTSAPKALMSIVGSAGGVSANPAANTLLLLEHAGNATLQFITGSANTQSINFGDPDAAAAGAIIYTQNNDTMLFRAGGINTMLTFSSAAISLNASNRDADTTIFDAAGNAAIYVDASSSVVTGGAVGIETTQPAATFAVSGSFATLLREVQATATIAANDQIIKCSSSVGFSVWLPPATAGIKGRQYTIKNAMAGFNVRLLPNASELIDATASVAISALNSRTVVTDGVGWLII